MKGFPNWLQPNTYPEQQKLAQNQSTESSPPKLYFISSWLVVVDSFILLSNNHFLIENVLQQICMHNCTMKNVNQC